MNPLETKTCKTLRKIIKGLKSRTFWVLAFDLTLNVVQAADPFMNSVHFAALQAVLVTLAIHFKLNPSQRY